MFQSRRITLYVMREVVGATILSLVLWTFMLLMNHLFLVAEKAISKNLGLELTLRLFVLGIPELLVLTVPVSVLLGTLIALGRLSADHEWVALQSAGLGTRVLLRPVLAVGCLGALVGFLLYAVVVPQAHYAQSLMTGDVVLASKVATDVKPRVFYDLPQRGAVLFVQDVRPDEDPRLAGVLLIQPSADGRAIQLILGRSADFYAAPDRSGALVLDVYDGAAHDYDTRSGENYTYVAHFDRVTQRLQPESFLRDLLRAPERQTRDFTLPELLTRRREAREQLELQRASAPAATGSRLLVAQRRFDTLRVELHQRLALPLASVVFSLLALPLGLSRGRSGKGAGFALSLLVVVLYRATFVLARNQSISGNISPSLGPWIGNILMLLWAVYLFWRMRRPSGSPGITTFVVAGARRLAGLLARRGSRRKPRSPGLVAQDLGEDMAALGGTANRFVGRLDHYIGLTYLRILSFTVIAAYVIYGLVELQPLVDGALRTRQSLTLVLRYFEYFVPTTLPVVLPISCLVGAVVAFTLLSKNGELTAIKAGGIGMRRATVPVLVLTGVLCGLLFLVQDRITPAANRKAQTIKDQIMGRAPRNYGTAPAGRWSFGTEGHRLYHYKVYDPAAEAFQGLSVFDIDRDTLRITQHRYTPRAVWRGSSWELEGGWQWSFPLPGEEPGFRRFTERTTRPLDPPSNFVRKELSLTSRKGDLSDQMSQSELQRQIATLRDSGFDITRLEVAYHGKFSNAVAPLVMVLLGLPFAFKVGARGSLYGIGVALLLVLVYWATFAIFNALGLETLLRPYIAAWGPNALFGLLGIYLMLYIRT